MRVCGLYQRVIFVIGQTKMFASQISTKNSHTRVQIFLEFAEGQNAIAAIATTAHALPVRFLREPEDSDDPDAR